MDFRIDSKFVKWLWCLVRGYDHEKYWSRRQKVVDPNSGTPTWLKLYYLYYIKKTDARHGCSFGTALNSGARFAEAPILLHGPNGIIVGHDSKIGRHVTILQQVTIEHGGGDGIEIGDNCVIGAGAKLLKNVKIGNNCRIGANAVVIENMPDNSTCVLTKPRIIIRNTKS